jgi:hypothetical protein
MRLIRCVAGLFLAVVLVHGPGTSVPGQPLPSTAAQPAAAAPPLPSGPAPDLDLVFTGQVAGYVEPCG